MTTAMKNTERPNTKESFPAKTELPISLFEKPIKEMLRNSSSMILIGETGSGKSTKGPQYIADVLKEMKPGAKIAVAVPRKIAATSLAPFVNSQSEHEASYHVRFDRSSSSFTDINFMTDGWLLNYLKNNPLLEEFDAVLIDEAHERSLNIDLLMVLLKMVQQKRQEQGLPELKLIIASATIDEEKFKSYFNAESISVPGKMYPVTPHFEEQDTIHSSNFIDKTSAKVTELLENGDGDTGDILVFLPGKKEIEAVQSKIGKQGKDTPGVQVLPLHGQISSEEQSRAFRQTPGVRKVLLATNMAETSITLPNVTKVIDTGYINQTGYDATSGVSSLRVTNHSKAGLRQRAGRAGRVQPGDYHFIGSEAQFAERPDFTEPEINRANLDDVVMMLLARDDVPKDIEQLDFLDKPSAESIRKSIQTLAELGAIDDSRHLTALGEKMSKIPLEPHLARMVIESVEHGVLDEVVSAISFMGLKPVFLHSNDSSQKQELERKQTKFKDTSSDFIGFLKVWQAYSKELKGNKSPSEIRQWAQQNGLNIKVLQEAAEIRWQILSTTQKLVATKEKGGKGEREEPKSEAEIRKNHSKAARSIALGLAGQLREIGSRGMYHGVNSGTPSAKIFPGSAVMSSGAAYIVSAEIKDTSARYSHKNQVVEPEWLPDIAPLIFGRVEKNPRYDESSHQVVAETRIIKKSTEQTVHTVSEGATPKQIREYLLEYCAHKTTAQRYHGVPELNAMLSENDLQAKKISRLHIRSAGHIQIDGSQVLDKYYQTLLSQISFVAGQSPFENNDFIESLQNNPFGGGVSEDEKAIQEYSEYSPESIQIQDKTIPVAYTKNGEQYIATVDLGNTAVTTDIAAEHILTPGLTLKYIAKFGGRDYGFDSFSAYREAYDDYTRSTIEKKYPIEYESFQIQTGTDETFDAATESFYDEQNPEYILYPYLVPYYDTLYSRKYTLNEDLAIEKNDLARKKMHTLQAENAKREAQEQAELARVLAQTPRDHQGNLMHQANWDTLSSEEKLAKLGKADSKSLSYFNDMGSVELSAGLDWYYRTMFHWDARTATPRKRGSDDEEVRQWLIGGSYPIFGKDRVARALANLGFPSPNASRARDLFPVIEIAISLKNGIPAHYHPQIELPEQDESDEYQDSDDEYRQDDDTLPDTDNNDSALTEIEPEPPVALSSAEIFGKLDALRGKLGGNGQNTQPAPPAHSTSYSFGYDEPVQKQAAPKSKKEKKKEAAAEVHKEIKEQTTDFWLNQLVELGVDQDMVELIEDDADVLKHVVVWIKNPANRAAYQALTHKTHPIPSTEQTNVQYFIDGITSRLDPKEALIALQQLHNSQENKTTKFADDTDAASLLIDLRDYLGVPQK
jgi:HrpA-like RNA helicase